MTKSVSGPVAVLMIILALLLFAALFHNARLAPPEKLEPPRPPEPNVEEQEVAMMRRGLRPLGVTTVLAPLVEDRGKGARIASVAPNSPAEKAGIQIGDRVEEFNGAKTPHPMSMMAILNNIKPGQSVPVVVNRSGKTIRLTVKGIVPLPPEEQPRP